MNTVCKSFVTRHVSRAKVFLVLPALLGGCASVNGSHYAHPMSLDGRLAANPRTASGLEISGDEDGALASPQFGFVALTFENRSTEWVRVRNVTATFGKPGLDQAVFIPQGEELAEWARATVQRNRVRSTNTALALGALELAGSVTYRVAENRNVRAVGAAVAAGASVAEAATDISQGVAAVDRPPLYPETHLYATPFSVPPGLFTKRWIVLNTPVTPDFPCLTSMLVSYELMDGRKERVWLEFRAPVRTSEWQKAICKRRAAARPAR